VHPRQADEIHPGHARHAALVRGIPAAVEHRHLDPTIVRAVADRPHHAADARAAIVELGDLALRLPHRHVARFGRCVDAVRRDVRIDRVLDVVRDRVRAIEVRGEIRREVQHAVTHAGEPPIELHALARERAQIDIVAAAATGHVVVRVVAHAMLERVLRDGEIVVAERVEPPHDVATAVAARGPWCGTDAQVHAPAGEVQILGELRAGLTGADDEHVAAGQRRGVRVRRRMDVRDVVVEALGEARQRREMVAADRNDDRRGVPDASRRRHDEPAVFVGEVRHLDAFAHRRRERRSIRLDVLHDLVLHHEAVGIVARIGKAGQLALPVRRDEREAVPAFGAPRMADAMPLEHDVIDAVLLQAPTRGKPGLAGADDDRRNLVHAANASTVTVGAGSPANVAAIASIAAS